MSGTHEEGVLFAPRVIERLDDCFFYHAVDLPGFGPITGLWDLRGRFDEYVGRVEVNGKPVLDVGTATGFLTFEAERRGATQVLSFDQQDAGRQAFLPFQQNRYVQDHQGWAEWYNAGFEKWKNAYWLSHRALKSKAQVYHGDIYHLPKELGEFDIAIVGSVLEHLSDPISALASIARLVTETIVIVTPLLDHDEPFARFAGRADQPEADYTWWTYSPALYREVFAMLGFRIARISHARFNHSYVNRIEERATIVAVRNQPGEKLGSAGV